MNTLAENSRLLSRQGSGQVEPVERIPKIRKLWEEWCRRTGETALLGEEIVDYTSPNIETQETPDNNSDPTHRRTAHDDLGGWSTRRSDRSTSP